MAFYTFKIQKKLVYLLNANDDGRCDMKSGKNLFKTMSKLLFILLIISTVFYSKDTEAKQEIETLSCDLAVINLMVIESTTSNNQTVTEYILEQLNPSSDEMKLLTDKLSNLHSFLKPHKYTSKYVENFLNLVQEYDEKYGTFQKNSAALDALKTVYKPRITLAFLDMIKNGPIEVRERLNPEFIRKNFNSTSEYFEIHQSDFDLRIDLLANQTVLVLDDLRINPKNTDPSLYPNSFYQSPYATLDRTVAHIQQDYTFHPDIEMTDLAQHFTKQREQALSDAKKQVETCQESTSESKSPEEVALLEFENKQFRLTDHFANTAYKSVIYDTRHKSGEATKGN
jgi:hypothetical protein